MIDHIVVLRDIPLLLTALVAEDAPTDQGSLGPHMRAMESDLAEVPIAVQPGDRPGRPSVFSCPECHGTLWEVDENGLLRFRCRVGHVYSPDSMLAAQTDEVDRALWVALRTLEERAALAHKLADRARHRDHHWVARAFSQRACEAETEATQIRALLRARSAATLTVPDDASSTAAEPGDNIRMREPDSDDVPSNSKR
jgi:two-component system chemotaxis response regulator CheB